MNQANKLEISFNQVLANKRKYGELKSKVLNFKADPKNIGMVQAMLKL